MHTFQKILEIFSDAGLPSLPVGAVFGEKVLQSDCARRRIAIASGNVASGAESGYLGELATGKHGDGTMLVLSRKVGEEVVLDFGGRMVRVILHTLNQSRVQLAFDGPGDIRIVRGELLHGATEDNRRRQIRAIKAYRHASDDSRAA